MKKIGIITILFSFLMQNTYNQFTCDAIHESSKKKSSGPIIDYLDYIPDGSTPIKYIRLNFHFMLLEDSHPDFPGNFTPYDDGRGDTDFTGYDFVDDLLYYANQRLSGNIQMLYPLGNSTPVISRKYRFVLNGVFFHKSNTYYYYSHSPISTYSKNIGESINVFFQSDTTIDSGGYANMDGNRHAVFKGKWDVYNYWIDSIPCPWGNWGNAAGLMHEIGHNLSLQHTMMTSNGYCDDTEDDYCTDTPTRGYVKTHDGVDPCCQGCQWGNDTNSNNIMEYSGYDAITPEQLGRVHWTIDEEIEEYKSCYYTTSTLTITNFTENASYIAETISIPSSSNITIDDDEALYINCDGITISGNFEAKLGAKLIIRTENDCN
ncbi:M43 family zinc metalloprotease [Bacteroidota bacterium]